MVIDVVVAAVWTVELLIERGIVLRRGRRRSTFLARLFLLSLFLLLFLPTLLFFLFALLFLPLGLPLLLLHPFVHLLVDLFLLHLLDGRGFVGLAQGMRVAEDEVAVGRYHDDCDAIVQKDRGRGRGTRGMVSVAGVRVVTVRTAAAAVAVRMV